jgi:hypothetical protein
MTQASSVNELAREQFGKMGTPPPEIGGRFSLHI